MTDQPAFVPPTDPTATPAAPAVAPAPTAPTMGRGSIVSDSADDDGRFGIVVHAPAGGNPHVLWLGEATEAVLPLFLIRA